MQGVVRALIHLKDALKQEGDVLTLERKHVDQALLALEGIIRLHNITNRWRHQYEEEEEQ